MQSELTLNVEGIKSIEGKIAILVFNEANGFPENNENAVMKLVVDVTSSEMTIPLGKLPYGNYAIAIIHDKNSNKQFDKNILGIPKEPFGFSNTEKIYFGPPSFSEAAITLNGEKNQAIIKLLEI